MPQFQSQVLCQHIYLYTLITMTDLILQRTTNHLTVPHISEYNEQTGKEE